MAGFAGVATILTLIIFVMDMSLFGVVRNRLRESGIPAQYGNANWLVLGAAVALMLGMCTGTCGIFGSYRRKPRGSY
jgi:Na+/serine symporter